jgi:hypothetical protein
VVCVISGTMVPNFGHPKSGTLFYTVLVFYSLLGG